MQALRDNNYTDSPCMPRYSLEVWWFIVFQCHCRSKEDVSNCLPQRERHCIWKSDHTSYSLGGLFLTINNWSHIRDTLRDISIHAHNCTEFLAEDMLIDFPPNWSSIHRLTITQTLNNHKAWSYSLLILNKKYQQLPQQHWPKRLS